LKGKKETILGHLTSGVPGKHKAGGQSQRRFDRVIEDLAHQFLKRIGDHMNETFLPLKDDLKGIIIGGPGFTKKDFYDGDYLQYELKNKVISIVDTSYTGEEGIREVIARAADDLENLDVMHEKKLVQKFIHELRKDKGLCSYGENQVRNNLIMGAVDTLLLSEDLTSMRKKFTCTNCGQEKDITVKTQAEADNLNEKCPNCNDTLKETDSMDLADEFVELAEEMNTDVEFISTETEEGTQIYRAFGGIAAILRYYVDY
jgi:peptide chain release factor subunit 1